MNSNAAARKRRGVPSATPVIPSYNNTQQNQYPQQNQYQAQAQSNMMSIQQIIRYLDSRLVNLEKTAQTPRTSDNNANDTDPNTFVKLAIEYNERFNMMAKEISDIHSILADKDAKIAHLENTISLLQTMHNELDEEVNKLVEGENKDST
jgi:chromosome segregation ATPase